MARPQKPAELWPLDACFRDCCLASATALSRVALLRCRTAPPPWLPAARAGSSPILIGSEIAKPTQYMKERSRRPRRPAWGTIAVLALVTVALALAWRYTPLADVLTAERISNWSRSVQG